MKRILSTLIVTMAALLVQLPVRAETLEAVESAINNQWNKLNSVSYDVEVKSVMKGGSSTMNIMETRKVEMLRDGAKMKLNVVMKSVMDSSATGKSELGNSVVVDGDFSYALMEAFGKKIVTKMKPDVYTESLDYAGGKVLFEQLHKYLALALLPDETVDGVPCYVIEGKDKPVFPTSLTKKYYFSKENGMLIQSVAASQPGSAKTTGSDMNITMKVLNLKIDPSLPPAHFTFTPPAGAELQDQTKQ